MSRKQFLALLLTGLLVGAGALAQEAQPAQAAGTETAPMPIGPDPNQPAAESIFQRIPADCAGFVATKNIRDLLANVEKFMGKIEMSDMLAATTSAGGMLPMMAAGLGLGEGFNPNGGMALVVPDLEKSGLNVDELMEGQDLKVPPPIVILLAGKEIEKVFPDTTTKAEDGSVMVAAPGLGPMHAKKLGDYIALSPNPQALAQMETGQSVEAAVPADQKQILLQSDIALHYNVQVIAPLVKKMVEAQQKKLQSAETAASQPASDEVMPPLTGDAEMAMMFKMLGPMVEMIEQINSVTEGLRMVETGLVIDAAVDVKPDTDMAKIIAANQPTTKSLMDRLPNLPYVLAGGMVVTATPEYVEQSTKMMKMMLGMLQLEVPQDLQDQITSLGQAFSEQVTGEQFVAGAPKEKGVFGYGVVLECKDAAKAKELLPKQVDLATELVQKTVAVKIEDLSTLSIKYEKNVETVDGLSVDAMVIDHKELQEMDEKKKADLVAAMGEDKIRLLVAQPNDTTLVLSIGGSTEFLSEMIKAAKDGGTIPSDPGVVEALKNLPAERVMVLVLSPKNLFDTIQAGMKKMNKPSDLPEGFAFQGTTPLAMGSTVKGNTCLGTLYIPATAIKDVIQWVMAEMASAAVGMPATESLPAGEPADSQQSDF